MSLPQFNFGQALAVVTPNAPVNATGTLSVKNGELAFAGATQTDFDAAIINAPTPYTIQLPSGGQCFAGSCYGASVDNEIFEIRKYSPFVASVNAQPCSLDGRIPAKTVISLILDGKSYTGTDGGTFNETVSLELTFADPMLPDTKLSSASLLRNSTVYAMVKGDSSNITISDFVWSTDHKSFNFSVDFDCVMRSWEHATTGQPDVTLKGEMSKIRVTVPGWMTASK